MSDEAQWMPHILGGPPRVCFFPLAIGEDGTGAKSVEIPSRMSCIAEIRVDLTGLEPGARTIKISRNGKCLRSTLISLVVGNGMKTCSGETVIDMPLAVQEGDQMLVDLGGVPGDVFLVRMVGAGANERGALPSLKIVIRHAYIGLEERIQDALASKMIPV